MTKKLRIPGDYRAYRRQAYPISGDALDAIQKGFRALMDQGIELPPETVTWVEACENVKRIVRKPQS